MGTVIILLSTCGDVAGVKIPYFAKVMLKVKVTRVIPTLVTESDTTVYRSLQKLLASLLVMLLSVTLETELPDCRVEDPH